MYGAAVHRRFRFAQRIDRTILAFLCLRALIPAGFMLAPVDGHLEVVLCDAAGAMTMHHPKMAEMPGMKHMPGMDHAAVADTDSDAHSAPGHAHADPTCPYAQSAGPAPLPALPALPRAHVVQALPVAQRSAQLQSAFGPRRAQTPRAPPALA